MTVFARNRLLASLTVLVGLVLTLGLGPQGAALDATPSADTEGTLRVCVLSDDMPLSHEGPDSASGRQGLYLDLAREMARSRQESMSTHFAITAFYKRPVREGLLAKACDAFFGLPRTEGPWFIRGKVALSKAFTQVGYALVTPKGTPVQSLEDLTGKVVGVQGGSPGALAVALADDVEPFTVRYPEPALDALDRGDIDAALVWGPRAGYLNKYRYDDRFDVHPTSLTWPVAIGVRAEDAAMVDTFNALIDRFATRTEALRTEYGFPNASLVAVRVPGREADDGPKSSSDGEPTGDAAPGAEPAGRTQGVHGIGKSRAQGVEASLLTTVAYAVPRPVVPDSIEGDPEAGQKMFNAIYGCAHCHGTNAEGATAPTDLRKLRQRYGENAEEKFAQTVREGREGTAMPPWEGVISDEKIEDIKAFIFSIQVAAEE